MVGQNRTSNLVHPWTKGSIGESGSIFPNFSPCRLRQIFDWRACWLTCSEIGQEIVRIFCVYVSENDWITRLEAHDPFRLVFTLLWGDYHPAEYSDR